MVQCQSSLLVPVEEAERAPKLTSLVERCFAESAASKTTALAYHLIRLDVPKTGKIVPKCWIHDYP